MKRCILFKIKDKVFKFDNIYVSDSGFNPTISNIISLLIKYPDYLNLLDEVIRALNDSTIDEKIDLGSNVSRYADNIVGEFSLAKLTSSLEVYDNRLEQLTKLSPSLQANADNIKLSKDNLIKVLVGNTRNIILSSKDRLSSGDMVAAVAYNYMDSKSKDITSPIYKTLEMGYELLRATNLESSSELILELLAELDSLDTVNRNKRLLAALYNRLFDNSPEVLYIKTRLLEFVDSDILISLKVKNLAKDKALARYLTSIKNELFEINDLDISGQELTELMYLLLDATGTMDALEFILMAREIDEELLDKVIEDLGLYRKSIIIAKEFTARFLSKNNSEITYDSSFTPSDFKLLELIIKNPKLFGKYLEFTKADSKFSVNDIVDSFKNILGIGTLTIDINEPINYNNLNIELSSDLFSKPSKSINFILDHKKHKLDAYIITGSKWRGNSESNYISTAKSLIVNPSAESFKFKKTDTSKYQAVYLTDDIVTNSLLLHKVLEGLINTGIKFINIKGYGPQSVRAAMDAINAGFGVRIFVDNNFKFDNLENASLLDYINRYAFITPLSSSVLNPLFKFYNANSSNGWDFSNKNGNTNLNTELSEREAAGEELNYRELFRNDEISVLPVSKSKWNLLGYLDGDIVNILDLNDPSKSIRKRIIRRYRLNGTLRPGIRMFTPGSAWSFNRKNYLLVGHTDTTVKLLDMELLLNSNFASLSYIEVTNENMEKYTYLGNYPLNGRLINFLNKVILEYLSEKYILNPSQEYLTEFYENDLESLSADTGFSTSYIKRNFFKEDIANYTFMEFANVDEELPKQNMIPNFRGINFARLLAAKIGTKINFLTNALYRGLGLDPLSSGAIYNGEVYINLDNMKENTAFHELTHLILAYIKNKDYIQYSNLLEIARRDLAILDEVLELYPELTEADRLEEALAELISRSMADRFADPNLESQLLKLGFSEAIEELLGIEEISDIRGVMTSSILELTEESKELSNDLGPIFKRNTYLMNDRISSVKTQLKRNGELIEKCD